VTKVVGVFCVRFRAPLHPPLQIFFAGATLIDVNNLRAVIDVCRLPPSFLGLVTNLYKWVNLTLMIRPAQGFLAAVGLSLMSPFPKPPTQRHFA
jgi:hypothetical protein